MTNRASVTDHERTLTVRVPMVLLKRGGRRHVVTPDGAASVSKRLQVDDAMVKALARAFRWRKLMETGAYATVAEIAVAERVNDSYVSRILRLTLLAPDIVEAILAGSRAPEFTLHALMMPFSSAWREQRAAILGGSA